MDASEYLESQLGQTLENIKEEYISGKRFFFLKTKDLDLLYGQICPMIWISIKIYHGVNYFNA